MALGEICHIKGCPNPLGPGSVEVGFEIEGRDHKLRACPFHSKLIVSYPPGSWRITPDNQLEPVRARPLIIDIKKKD